MASERKEQLAYSEQMAAMLDEDKRRQKAAKILAVLRHALGRDDLSGLRAVDVGCSAGFIADELAGAGATTHGVDIDEPGLARARRGSVTGSPSTARRATPCRSRTAASTSWCSTTSTSTSSTPTPSCARSTGCCPPTGSSTSVWPTGSGWSSRTTGCRSCPGCRTARSPTATCGLRPGRPLLRAVPHAPRLRRLVAAFDTWDYTLPVLTDPAAFNGGDVVPRGRRRVPARVLDAGAAAGADLHLGRVPDAAARRAGPGAGPRPPLSRPAAVAVRRQAASRRDLPVAEDGVGHGSGQAAPGSWADVLGWLLDEARRRRRRGRRTAGGGRLSLAQCDEGVLLAGGEGAAAGSHCDDDELVLGRVSLLACVGDACAGRASFAPGAVVPEDRCSRARGCAPGSRSAAVGGGVELAVGDDRLGEVRAEATAGRWRTSPSCRRAVACRGRRASPLPWPGRW